MCFDLVDLNLGPLGLYCDTSTTFLDCPCENNASFSHVATLVMYMYNGLEFMMT